MTEPGQTNGRSTAGPRRPIRIGLTVVAVCLGVLLLLAICIRIYLASGLPAPLLSKLVTSYLHQDFTVDKLQLSDGSVVLKGVRLQSPAGFPARPLVTAESVAVAPAWFDLLRGRQRFERILLSGVTVNLDKNARGSWNYSDLQRLLASRKPSPKETVVEQLVIRDGAIKLQGEGVQGLSLQIYNLTTKGSLDSKLALTFQDPAGNLFQVKGKARAGADAAVDLTVTAPSLSLKQTVAFLKFKDPDRFQGGTGALSMYLSLHKGEVSVSGDVTFRGVTLPGKVPYPVAGSLHFAADYDPKSDSAQLRRSTLAVEKLARLHAEGKATALKSRREFSLLLGMEDFDLGTLNVLLPDQVRKGSLVGGRLRCDRLQVEGSAAQGMRSATGVIELQDGTLTRKGQLVVAGLSGTLGFSRNQSAIASKGRLSVSTAQPKALLEKLDLPLSATLSPRLKPLAAEVTAFSAKMMGIPMTGNLSYAASSRAPLAASVKIPTLQLSALNGQFKRFGLQASSGTGSLTLDVAGKGARELSGTAKLQVADFRGSLGKKSLSVKSGAVAASGERRGEKLAAQGDAQLGQLLVDGKGGDAKLAFKVADDLLQLEKVQANAAGLEIAVSRLAARLPSGHPSAKAGGFPLAVEVTGATVKQRQVTVTDLTGVIRGNYHDDGGQRWLDGRGDLSSGSLLLQGKRLGAPVLHAVFSKYGAKTELGGDLLGGKLSGTASLNPFAPAAGTTFDARVAGADVAAGSPFIPKADAVKPTEGRLDLHLAGGYSARDGFACRFEGKGSGVGISGAGGKRLVAGAGLSLSGEVAREKLSVHEGVVSLAPKVSLRLQGDIAQPFTDRRSGVLSFNLPVADVNSVVDPLVNVLPRLLQAATLDGTIGAQGKLTLKDGRQLLEGTIAVQGGQLSVPAQKLVMADINGNIPVSLDLSRKGGAPEQAMSFSRDNFRSLLGQLRKGTGGENFSIRKIAFGPVEFGTLTTQLTAVNGVTRLSSLKTTLFQGEVLGKGYVLIGDKVVYRGDLLIHNLSLKTLCSVFPNIAGYISGRVDGVVSLSGHGGGVADMTGFMELWAREKRGEKMEVSKEFLQRLAKQKLAGFFFSSNRPYDQAEIKAELQEGYLTFDKLVIEHTNFIGVRDLSVSVATDQNRIAFNHLLDTIKEAAVRGKPKASKGPAPAPEAPASPASPSEPAPPAEAPGEAPGTEAPAPEFKWGE
ncbi:AsmA family protein [Geomonas sp.]|uniref:DUF748 domain-containing protein n=1 Tax=Geomonas sp. TaxID=2651584 RepID=UPI002B4AA2BC|nr:AsmA family protein [Geomonas sp.]HJV36625.1 AsmA family protein [Geomonas sp.]